MGDSVIELENVWFRYDEPVVLEDVSLRVSRGEFLGVVGPNGGGKTTLLRLILGQLAPEHGSVRVLGETPVRARRRIGYVPQRVIQFRRADTRLPRLPKWVPGSRRRRWLQRLFRSVGLATR